TLNRQNAQALAVSEHRRLERPEQRAQGALAGGHAELVGIGLSAIACDGDSRVASRPWADHSGKGVRAGRESTAAMEWVRQNS
ncbi:MAG: hypothetical protein ACO3FE_21860, partial [Planctomycetaceae bacterium]